MANGGCAYALFRPVKKPSAARHVRLVCKFTAFLGKHCMEDDMRQVVARFRAEAASIGEEVELGVYTIVLAEQASGDGLRLELQRSGSFDDHDRALGQDTYCLCTTDGATSYGGVEQWEITDGPALRLKLDAKAASTLGVSEFVIDFRRDLVADLSRGLRHVINGDAIG